LKIEVKDFDCNTATLCGN